MEIVQTPKWLQTAQQPYLKMKKQQNDCKMRANSKMENHGDRASFISDLCSSGEYGTMQMGDREGGKPWRSTGSDGVTKSDV
ncbi:hypothetical protein QVD17_08514 [Tagetes erecta]|uniref:Uncharacterized protein n=1 Tax=Tagetes erecta TaxID=13708 RepID=A0AAD8NXM5_TARER|nr:hypothetical protein QVD17_08514 [Tagetes erecta]